MTRAFILASRPLPILCCLLAGSAAAPAHAQDSVDERLDRVERDLNQLQRQVDHAGEAGAGADAAQPGEAGAPGGVNTQALNTQLRLDQIENTIRQLNGQLEELQFGLAQMKTRLDKMQNDSEQRFQALEHPGVAGPAAASGGMVPPAAPNGGDQDGAPAPDAGASPSPPGASGFLVPPPGVSAAAPDGDAATPPQPPAARPQAQTQAPAGTPQQQYARAFNQLRQAKYPEAEAAFRGFIQKHPRDPLAGSAQYWLGEIYFVQKAYDKSAAIFAEGYQKYPRSPKAADNLLKLGQSLAATGHKAEACAAFQRLDRDFPTATPAVRASERQEKKHLGCG